MNIGVLASHGGSDMQAIIDGCKNNLINGKVVVVISNNSDSYALERARNENIDCYHISEKSDSNYVDSILKVLEEHKVDYIFLAGYMKMLDKRIIDKYYNRIFNIHPALLPNYGGKGMYGIHVHEAVIANHEKYTGVTIHRVNNEYDRGEIVAQTKVRVLKKDTPLSLRDRVLEREHEFLVEVNSKICDGKIKIG